VSGIRSGALVLAGRLVSYPGPAYADDLRAFAELSSQLGVSASPEFTAFVTNAGEQSVEALQEMFTQTFDMTPASALEVGWHLFGEDYARGAFLARMRVALRDHGIREGSELPDHLASMLTLVTRVDTEEADLLVKNALLPAVDKMLASLEKHESPFHPALHTIREVLADGSSTPAEVHHG
jgi:nitrate reductase molybdenum cofactor assembly chaperone